MHLTCRKDCIHNHLQENKDETCSEEQVTTCKEEYDDTFKEFKRPQTQCSYVTLLSDIIDVEPYSYEEVAKKKGKENTSSRRMMARMRYRRPKGKSIVYSIWIYKIQHAVDDNIMGYKAGFLA